MKIENLEDCVPILLGDQRVRDLADDLEVGGSAKIHQDLGSESSPELSYSNEFIDGVIEVMTEEAVEVDSIEIECLSCYAEVSTITLTEFAGIFAIRNFEFGDLIYFSTAASAKQAVLEKFGVEWDHPEKFTTVINANSLNPGES